MPLDRIGSRRYNSLAFSKEPILRFFSACFRPLRLFSAAAALLLFVLSSSIASAQSVGMPRAEDNPFAADAQGFLQAHVGLAYIPVFQVEGFHREPDTEVDEITGAAARIPGFQLGIGLFPAFNYHMFMAEVGYTLFGAEYDTALDFEAETFNGTTTWGMSTISINVGYGYYFLDGPWHFYPLVLLNMRMERIRATVDYEGEDEMASEDRFTNYGGGVGFGCFRTVSTGGIGGEIRVTSPFMESKFEFTDPWGKAEYTLTHPVTVYLLATFMLGHLQ
jgi:hypothetical protein